MKMNLYYTPNCEYIEIKIQHTKRTIERSLRVTLQTLIIFPLLECFRHSLLYMNVLWDLQKAN